MRRFRPVLVLCFACLVGLTARAQTVVSVPEAPDAVLTIFPADAGLDPDARLSAALEAGAKRHGGIVQRAKPMSVEVDGTSIRLHGAAFADAPRTLRSYLTTAGSARVCEVAVPFDRAGANMRPVGSACLAALRGDGGSAAAAPVPATRPIAAAAHSQNWSRVEGVYFKSATGVGVGGMVTIDFEPVVLFKDGSYYEIDGRALEDIDLAAAKASKPRSWGRWSRQGTRFVLTDDRGRSDDHQLQQGNFFKAFPAAGARLAGTYSAVGGGGNTALGGDVMIASKSTLVFFPDGRFSTRRSTGALNSGASTGVGSSVAAERAGGGRFTVKDHTLTLARPDGSTERRFFAFASHHAPPQLDVEMIFVGDSAYTRDD